MLENIFRYIEEKGFTPFEAAIEGTREVTLPVMATTLSLVVIFLPVAFMTGYARRFIYPFGWTMAFAILVSMLVSFTLTPMLSSRFLKVADAESDKKTKERGFFHLVETFYDGCLRWTLAHPMDHHRRVGVAAGDGALSRCTTRPCRSSRKSSTRVPSRPHRLRAHPGRRRARGRRRATLGHAAGARCRRTGGATASAAISAAPLRAVAPGEPPEPGVAEGAGEVAGVDPPQS